MKRLLLMFLTLSLLLTGCFRRQSVDLSVDCYKLSIEILEVTDDYLDGHITPVIAAGQVQDLCRTLSGVPNEDGTMNQKVTNYCEMLSYTLTLVADGDHINEKEILNTRNTLANLLGEDAREK